MAIVAFAVKRLRFMGAVLCLLCISLYCVHSADAQGKSDFPAAEMKKMGVFLSNFTELGMYDFKTDTINRDKLINFGIWHNYMNNTNYLASCKIKDCPHGGFAMQAQHVSETIFKYFGKKFTAHGSVKSGSVNGDYRYYFDGKQYHFDGSDGEQVYYARVNRAFKNGFGQIVMTGELYNADEPGEKLGSFTALARPHKYNNKNTWAILEIKTIHY